MIEVTIFFRNDETHNIAVNYGARLMLTSSVPIETTKNDLRFALFRTIVSVMFFTDAANMQLVMQTPYLGFMMSRDFRGYGAGRRLAEALGISATQASAIRNGTATSYEKLAAHYGYVVGDEPGHWIQSLTCQSARDKDPLRCGF